MTGVGYQENSDRPLGGPRIEAMCEMLFEMTRENLRELPACQADDWIAGTCRCINAIPTIHIKAAWVRVFARQMARFFSCQSEQEFVAAIADRLADEKVAWIEDKRAHYQELKP